MCLKCCSTVYLCRHGNSNRVVMKQIIVDHLNDKELKVPAFKLHKFK